MPSSAGKKKKIISGTLAVVGAERRVRWLEMLSKPLTTILLLGFVWLPETMFARLVTSFLFFNDTATTEIYTLSLHDALPISTRSGRSGSSGPHGAEARAVLPSRSEEHTSELQSRENIVCRLLLEKKKKS